MRSCYEAGREGFWIHRALIAREITNIDAASIEVNRRQRRAKTERLDALELETVDQQIGALEKERQTLLWRRNVR